MIAENLLIQPDEQQCNSRRHTKKGSMTYKVSEIAEMLKISKRTAYDFCNKTDEFKVVHIGRCVRVHKESFDNWFACCRTEI
ncbi:MAG: helix-turn-helix domain-containing protein [Oscillospiraceae bacterium]|nr:helix-turn-helix domain-containing protein [Oscillospiraceae bacterium]